MQILHLPILGPLLQLRNCRLRLYYWPLCHCHLYEPLLLLPLLHHCRLRPNVMKERCKSALLLTSSYKVPFGGELARFGHAVRTQSGQQKQQVEIKYTTHSLAGCDPSDVLIAAFVALITFPSESNAWISAKLIVPTLSIRRYRPCARQASKVHIYSR
jgi:hypothetical protein